MRRPALFLSLAAVIVLSACGGSDGASDDQGGGDELSSYDDVATMAADLDADGLTCLLEYEGLDDGTREVSLCSVNGEFTELSVWADPADAGRTMDEADTADDPLAGGANWTVDVDTAATAEAVAEALGGVAVGG